MNDIINAQKVFEFYENTFRPIYADVVAVVGNKPEQVVFEIEASFFHMANSFTNKDEEIRKRSITKSLRHLELGALDCSKILWLEHRKRINIFLSTEEVNLLSYKNDFFKLFKKAEKLAREARMLELKDLDNKNIVFSIEKYYESAILYSEVLLEIDKDVINMVTNNKKKKQVKLKMLKLSSAVATGIGGAFIANIFTNQYDIIVFVGIISSFFGFFASGVRQWIK